MEKKKLPVGISDFDDMILGNYYYVDKSLFIKEVIDKGDKILLIPRPRRFGKTLNLSMLKYFFECCPNTNSNSIPAKKGEEKGKADSPNKKLFHSLVISKAGKEYLDKMGKFPVIYLSFRTIKETDWEITYRKIKKLIRAEYSRHIYLLDSGLLLTHEIEYFQKVIDLTGEREDYENSLEMLLIFLYRFHGEKAVILIDEYDEPIHAGFSFGYYDEIINFMRNFLCGGLKDTGNYLEKAVLTGILRLAKESIFSGLNNPGVYTLLSSEFDDFFGFTEKEVRTMLEDFNLPHMYDGVQKWYNGYRFGQKVIYNPWSIINFLGSEDHELKPYWLYTSDNQIVDDLLSKGGKELKAELELLVKGETIEKFVKESIVLKKIDSNENILWSFLLMGGYLKSVSKRTSENTGKTYYSLAIPNMEVKTIYYEIIENFFAGKTGEKQLEIMLDALIRGDITLFETKLQHVVKTVFSYHDFGSEPEKAVGDRPLLGSRKRVIPNSKSAIFPKAGEFDVSKIYHALVAGLLVWLIDTHEVKSNRESGYGRYDIMIIPKNTTSLGYVIEFKAVDVNRGETVTAATKAALKQIEEKQYETELTQRGIQNIKKLAIVFNGKDVHVKDKDDRGST